MAAYYAEDVAAEAPVTESEEQLMSVISTEFKRLFTDNVLPLRGHALTNDEVKLGASW